VLLARLHQHPLNTLLLLGVVAAFNMVLLEAQEVS
jgi:hypothetical protein